MVLPALRCAFILSRKACRSPSSAFGCRRAFFICHPQFAQGLKDGIRGNAKARGTLILIRVGRVTHILHHILRQGRQIDLAFARPGRIRLQALEPAAKRGAPDTKSLRGLLKGEPFRLAKGQNTAAEGFELAIIFPLPIFPLPGRPAFPDQPDLLITGHGLHAPVGPTMSVTIGDRDAGCGKRAIQPAPGAPPPADLPPWSGLRSAQRTTRSGR